MKRWLIKSDPDDYSAADLERDRQTDWDGVRNALALRHIRAMRRGDAVLIYHTGDERAIVAKGTVDSDPRPGQDDESGKGVVVSLAFDSWLPHAVSMSAIRSDPAFAELALVRIGRLSVMPVTTAQWKRVEQLARRPAAAP